MPSSDPSAYVNDAIIECYLEDYPSITADVTFDIRIIEITTTKHDTLHAIAGENYRVWYITLSYGNSQNLEDYFTWTKTFSGPSAMV